MTDSTPKTMTIPEAGRVYLGVGRDASYQAARKGLIPFMWVGKYMRVPIAAMDRLMENPPREQIK